MTFFFVFRVMSLIDYLSVIKVFSAVFTFKNSAAATLYYFKYVSALRTEFSHY